MLTSGKFNSHFPLLGFDALKNERGEYTGIYTPNKEELKQVEWIMTSFLNVDRYRVLLEMCRKRNIKTKRGKYFTRSSLRTLLTNPRYIGKWYRNKHNADKRQNKLMPYERFAEVELGHGCVVDEGLWHKVQDKVRELDESRTRSVRHCYPLSGLLFFDDGSNFVGNGAWGQTGKSTYYYNRPNKLRVRTEIFESEAEKILHQIVENTPKFQKSMADYSARKKSSVSVVARKVSEVDARLGELEDEKQRLDDRLSYLLEDGDREMAQSFRNEYKRRFLALKSEERELEGRKRHLQLLQRQVAEAQEPTKNGGLEEIKKAISCIGKKDLVSLKSLYRRLFQKIIISPLDNTKGAVGLYLQKRVFNPSQVRGHKLHIG